VNPALRAKLDRLAEAVVEPDQPGELRVLARELPELVHVARRVLRGEQAIQFLQPGCQAVELDAQLGLHE